MKAQKDTTKKPSKKNAGVTKKEASHRDKLIVDAYFSNGYKKGDAVKVVADTGSQIKNIHLFNAVMAKPEVQQYARDVRAEIGFRNGLALENVIKDTIDVHTADYTKILSCKSHEEIAELPIELRRCIQDVDIKEREEYTRSGNKVITKELKFKLLSKDKAREELLKIAGAFELDNRQKRSAIDIENLTTEERNTALQFLKIMQKQKQNSSQTIDITPK